MKIKDILKNKKRLLSFEFFPPKKVENEAVLFETIESLKQYNPDFVSVTYGAGGSTRDQTVKWIKDIKYKYNLEVMMHLTCIGSSKNRILSIVKELKDNHIENILALRGDLPEGMPEEEIFKDFKYASELVEYLKNISDFSIGVAGYPEAHAESRSLEEDIENLKIKVDKGGDFIVTQLFFDNNYFYDYMDKLEKHNISVPVIPGIMPITNLKQVLRFTEMCAVKVPVSIIDKMKNKSADDMLKIGIDYAVKQCEDLMNKGVRGLHFYTLNKSKTTEEILKKLPLINA
jgi:methylenetetrahydrofolate reductase (NADPH)